jgi:hypothetical protein
MDQITLIFTNPINVSVQIGDTAYYTNDVNGDAIIKIGIITDINHGNNSISCEINAFTVRPTGTSFILFSKTNAANTSALKGYFAKIKFVDNSTNKSELFSVGSEIFASSK